MVPQDYENTAVRTTAVVSSQTGAENVTKKRFEIIKKQFFRVVFFLFVVLFGGIAFHHPPPPRKNTPLSKAEGSGGGTPLGKARGGGEASMRWDYVLFFCKLLESLETRSRFAMDPSTSSEGTEDAHTHTHTQGR